MPVQHFLDMENPSFVDQNFWIIKQKKYVPVIIIIHINHHHCSGVYIMRPKDDNSTKDTLEFLAITKWKDYEITYPSNVHVSLKELVDQNVMTMDSETFYSLKYYIIM